MAITLGIRTSGTLSTAQTTIYQTTTSQQGAFTITLVNTGSSVAKVDIWTKDGTNTARRIYKEMELDPKDSHSTCKYTLGPGDSFEGKATNGLVDYTVEGLVQS